eukprot:3870627-Rhodomonas_salina.1
MTEGPTRSSANRPGIVDSAIVLEADAAIARLVGARRGTRRIEAPDEDEDVVDTDGEHDERDDLTDDQRRFDASERADCCGDEQREPDDEDARQRQQQPQRDWAWLAAAADAARHVEQHDEVADGDGRVVCCAAARQLRFQRGLRAERQVQVVPLALEQCDELALPRHGPRDRPGLAVEQVGHDERLRRGRSDV